MLSDTANLPMVEGNLRATNRELKLQVIDGKKAQSSTGLADPRLFSGKQHLMCKMDLQSGLWSFQYTNAGLLPDALKGQFTSFSKAREFAEGYFLRRNIQITEVVD